MRQGQQHSKRMRGRGRKGPNPLNRSYESNGPDVKIRGTASHIADKYTALARDAQASGDPVMAESYLQHAEHYLRIIAAAQAQMQPQSQPQQEGQSDGGQQPRERSDGGEQPATNGSSAPEKSDADVTGDGAEAQPSDEAAAAKGEVVSEAAAETGEGNGARRRTSRPRRRRTAQAASETDAPATADAAPAADGEQSASASAESGEATESNAAV